MDMHMHMHNTDSYLLSLSYISCQVKDHCSKANWLGISEVQSEVWLRILFWQSCLDELINKQCWITSKEYLVLFYMYTHFRKLKMVTSFMIFAIELIEKYAYFLSCYLCSEILTSEFGTLFKKTKCVWRGYYLTSNVTIFLLPEL